MLNYCWTILGLPLAASAVIALLLIPAEKAATNKSLFRWPLDHGKGWPRGIFGDILQAFDALRRRRV